MSEPQRVEDWAAVESLEDFAKYLLLLHEDFQQDTAEVAEQEARGLQYVEGRWRHPAVGDYFEAWSAWLSDYYITGAGSDRRDDLDPPSWASFARQLWLAGMYE